MAKYRKLGRTASQRKALLRNQVTALLNNGKIVTWFLSKAFLWLAVLPSFLYFAISNFLH